MKKLAYPTNIAMRTMISAILLLLMGVFAPYPAIALTTEELGLYWYGAASDLTLELNTRLSKEVMAKAEPDECFVDVGDGNNIYDPYHQQPCSHNKVNQAYVWGLAKSGNDLWFGTAPNTHCLVLGGYLGMTSSSYEPGDPWVCEFGDSAFSPPLPASIGDWRPARIFVYDTQTETLSEKTQELPQPEHSGRLQATTGIRSAGKLGEVVILGGPNLSLSGGINLFAFNTRTGDFIDSAILSEYSNIRKWLVVNGVLYTAVGNSGGGGSVLRWKGNADKPLRSGDADDSPPQFEKVGNLDGSGAELAFHEGRLFVSTWPGGRGIRAGVWMSPVVPEDGLTNAHWVEDLDNPDNPNPWTKVWSVEQYEPDLVTAATYGGGAIASFDGYLYWGTMHVPFLAAVAHQGFYTKNPFTGSDVEYPELLDDQGNALPVEEVVGLAALGTHRPISIFRGRNFETAVDGDDGTSPEIELVYGMSKLPTFTANFNPSENKWINASWDLVDNNMGGAAPLRGSYNPFDPFLPDYGSSGFDNIFNNYTWTMAVFMNQLYVGTMDFSYLLEVGGEGMSLGQFDVPEWLTIAGADFYRFPSSDAEAIPESIEGVGNFSNYGIRTVISDDALYLGMANPMNLLTDDQGNNIGGWELIKLQDDDMLTTAVDPNDPALEGDYDSGIEVTSGDLEGAKIIYDSSEPVSPTFGPSDDIPPLNLGGVDAVAVPMNLQPSTTFDTPVKIFIPCPGYSDVSPLSVYLYDGTDWVLACDADGNVQPGAQGWMVPNTRENHNGTTPPTIKISVYHFTGVQAGGPSSSGVQALSTSGGGGGCFISSAAYRFCVACVLTLVAVIVGIAVMLRVRTSKRF